jgi:hypothetical protein
VQSPSREPVSNPADVEIRKEAERKEVENITAEPTKQQSSPTVVNSPLPIRKPVAGWKLGKTSEKYESGGRGPGTVNDYLKSASGDYGGASYGTYQLASYLPPLMPNGKSRPSATKSALVSYINGSRFAAKLRGLKPATKEFDDAWKAIALEHREEFNEDQHEYIKKAYYDVMISGLKRSGLDMTNYGPAVQDLIWSTAVQFGPGKLSVFTEPLKGKSNLTEAEIVNLVSDHKINNVDSYFRSSSAGIRAGVKKRYAEEKTTLLKLIT